MEVTLQMLSVTLVVLGMFLSFGLIWAKRRARPAGGYRRAARHALGYGADDPELDPDNNQFTRPGAITVGEELCRRSGNSRKQQVATIYGKHTDERVDNALDTFRERCPNTVLAQERQSAQFATAASAQCPLTV